MTIATTEPTITEHEAAQVGRANASSATPIVFVHGLWLLPSSWDRWVMLFGGLDNIRDCIAFPKTQRASDLMTGAPGAVESKQLKELGIKLDL